VPFKSPSKVSNAFMSKDSTLALSSLLVKAGSDSPLIDLPALVRVDLTYLLIVSCGIVNGVRSAGFMLLLWFCSGPNPCHPSTILSYKSF